MHNDTIITRLTMYTGYRQRGDFRPLVVKRRNFLEVTQLDKGQRNKILDIIRREFKDIRGFELGKFDLENIKMNYVEYFV